MLGSISREKEKMKYIYHHLRFNVCTLLGVSAARILASLHERIDIERTISQIITSWPRLDRK